MTQINWALTLGHSRIVAEDILKLVETARPELAMGAYPFLYYFQSIGIHHAQSHAPALLGLEQAASLQDLQVL